MALQTLTVKDNLTPYNYSNGPGVSRIKYIVIHYFGSLGTAKSVSDYFRRPGIRASAHYALDDGKTVYRCVRDNNVAWHCGDSGKGTIKGLCTNSNSIGIEVRPYKIDTSTAADASKKDWYFSEAVTDNLVEFTRHMMELYGVPPERVVRHYDVTAKLCPRPWMGDDVNTYYKTTGNAQWQKFKERLVEEALTQEQFNQGDSRNYR